MRLFRPIRDHSSLTEACQALAFGELSEVIIPFPCDGTDLRKQVYSYIARTLPSLAVKTHAFIAVYNINGQGERMLHLIRTDHLEDDGD